MAQVISCLSGRSLFYVTLYDTCNYRALITNNRLNRKAPLISHYNVARIFENGAIDNKDSMTGERVINRDAKMERWNSWGATRSIYKEQEAVRAAYRLTGIKYRRVESPKTGTTVPFSTVYTR
ncbi:uncharacterized protein LOC122575223 [Bombus pyrosoma]|uniref:uncharacterized protein LOC122575223 n=1 Tax=Bombus pyrosoma TaxID=396416 RepID=UPI001CB95912|nr:uncharacterized protein LOC122575223 [Bombus pyrosoma]